MSAPDVQPRPASRRLVWFLASFVGVAIALTAAGTLIAIHHSDVITSTQARKGHQRDVERDNFERQISALSTRLRNTQQRDDAAICTLIVGSLVQAAQENPPRPVSPLIKPFLAQFGCKVPPGLLGD